MARNKTSGFTLIELMVVVAIVAILAAIALPSFGDQMRKSRRAEAVTALQDAQLRLEKWRVDHRDYVVDPVISFPASVEKFYTFTVTATADAPNAYVIAAAPKPGQDKDSCGTLKITKPGTAGRPDSKESSGPGETCW